MGSRSGKACKLLYPVTLLYFILWLGFRVRDLGLRLELELGLGSGTGQISQTAMVITGV